MLYVEHKPWGWTLHWKTKWCARVIMVLPPYPPLLWELYREKCILIDDAWQNGLVYLYQALPTQCYKCLHYLYKI